MSSTKASLLALLEENRGAYLSGGELADRLSVSRAAIWKAVHALQDAGYAIDAVPNRGYCLAPDCDILSPQGIGKYLRHKGLPLTVVPSAASTNALAREMADRGAMEGTVVIAGEQTAGRGRSGRHFFSPGGTGLYLSLLLRPRDYAPQQAVQLTALAAAAMCQAVEAVSGRQPGIKWVNDLILDGKKVCGILTEGAFGLETGALEYAVVGVGVNLYPPAGGFPEDIAPIAGTVFSAPQDDGKNRLAAAFLDAFLDGYSAPDRQDLLALYRRRSLAVGRPVTVCLGNQTRPAYAYGVDDACRLLVRYPDGREDALSYGEIRVKL